MRVGGYGEIENIRKAIQKDDKRMERKSSSGSGEGASVRGDSVEISSEGKQRAVAGRASRKLADLPEVRQSKIAQVRAEMADGTLTSEANVKAGIRKMVAALLS